MPRLNLNWRRRVRVDIACPHGRFIPAHYKLDGRAHRLTCDDCGFAVTLQDVRYRSTV